MKHRLFMAVVAASVAVPTSSVAKHETGGVLSPGAPTIDAVTCVDGQTATCPKGAELTVSGSELDGVKRVLFLGGKGREDDRAARPRSKSDDSLVVRVPSAAKTGPLVLEAGSGRARTQQVKVTRSPAKAAAVQPAPPAPPGQAVFPVAGPHRYGETRSNRFGGGRGHQGQDIFGDCGTPLVAPGPATVYKAATETNAGNYVVLTRPDGTSNAYMHMRDKALVAEGETVVAGQQIGVVGETGRASGCHLHFELWTAPGWYQGGAAVDPLPTLKAWDTTD